MKRIVTGLLSLITCGLLVFTSSCSRPKQAKVDAEHGGIQGRFSPAIAGVKIFLCESERAGTTISKQMDLIETPRTACTLRPSLSDTTDKAGTFAISMIPMRGDRAGYRSNEYVICYAFPDQLARLDLSKETIPLQFTGLNGENLKLDAEVLNGKAILKEDTDLGTHMLKKGAELQMGGPGIVMPGGVPSTPTVLPLAKGNVQHKETGLTLVIEEGRFVLVGPVQRNKVSTREISLPALIR